MSELAPINAEGVTFDLRVHHFGDARDDGVRSVGLKFVDSEVLPKVGETYTVQVVSVTRETVET